MSCGSSKDNQASPTGGTIVAKPSVWGLPKNISTAVGKAGLPMFGAEQLAVHYHSHLDVIVDGQPITVPANIGIDQTAQKISPLHVHDERGVIHIESSSNGTFTLGQFFDEWGVVLSSTQLGENTNQGDKTVRAYVNGTLVTDDPRNIVLRPHEEIAMIYGSPNVPAQVPSTFQFSQGE